MYWLWYLGLLYAIPTLIIINPRRQNVYVYNIQWQGVRGLHACTCHWLPSNNGCTRQKLESPIYFFLILERVHTVGSGYDMQGIQERPCAFLSNTTILEWHTQEESQSQWLHPAKTWVPHLFLSYLRRSTHSRQRSVMRCKGFKSDPGHFSPTIIIILEWHSGKIRKYGRVQ